MSARLIHFFAFYFHSWIGVSLWRERASTAMEIGKKRKSAWRRCIYRKYVSWNWLQKTQDEIYADVVLSRSHGSPGHWFPETEYLCASAIFVVGTNGIPPNLNYRSVKSYKLSSSFWVRLKLIVYCHNKNVLLISSFWVRLKLIVCCYKKMFNHVLLSGWGLNW